MKYWDWGWNILSEFRNKEMDLEVVVLKKRFTSIDYNTFRFIWVKQEEARASKAK